MGPARSWTIKGSAAAVIAALAMALLPGAAGAVPGEPQATFAGDGTLELVPGARSVGTDSQGRVIVASVQTTAPTSITVRRFTAAGEADPSFAGGGALLLAFGGTRRSAPTLLPSDAGVRVGVWTSTEFRTWSISDSGVLEAGYGTSGTASAPAPDTNGSVALPVDAVPVGDGLAVVWGEGASSQITRWDGSGHPLASFGGDGTVDGPEVRKPAAARPGGGLVVNSPQGLLPVAADGTFGTAVDVAGDASVTGLVVDAQDRPLLVLNTPAATTVLRRLTPDLALDSSYGAGGSVALAGGGAGFRTVAGRRFVVSSMADAPGDAASIGYRGRVWVVALQADGGLDTSFGSGGVLAVQDVASETTLMYGRDRPIATLVPAPAGGIAIGVEHHWLEASIAHERSEDSVRQVTSAGAPVATFEPAISTPSMVDGGDAGATFLAGLDKGAPDGSARWVRVELQQPDPPGAPGTPAITSVDGATFTLGWSAAAGQPDRYVVTASEPAALAPAATVEVPASLRTATITVPHTGRPYRFDVYAGAGTANGPRSAPTPYTLAPFASPLGFVTQLGRDVPTWRSGPGERAAIATSLGETGATENLLIGVAYDKGFVQQVDPVTRLYPAYFGRLPDTSGLRHWVAKRRSGTTLARISAQFAGSSEFQRTYGTLSDRAFVDRVYRNVLGRAPDPAGLEYWSGRLASGRTSRGQLMASFSESSEHVRKLAREAYAVRTYLMLLGRAPSTVEVAPWLAPEASGIDVIRAVLESPEYAERVG